MGARLDEVLNTIIQTLARLVDRHNKRGGKRKDMFDFPLGSAPALYTYSSSGYIVTALGMRRITFDYRPFSRDGKDGKGANLTRYPVDFQIKWTEIFSLIGTE